MKTEWQEHTIGDLCEMTPPKSEVRSRVSPDAQVSFAPMEELGIGRKYLTPTQQRTVASVVGSYTYFGEGDVLLAKITPCFENGKLGIAKDLRSGIGFGSSEFIVLRPAANLDNEFLYYYLLRAEFRNEGASRMGGAVGQQRVPKEFLESYPIKLPALSEQHRLVKLLDGACESIGRARTHTEESVRHARALFASRLSAVFAQPGPGWVARTLAQVSKEFGRGRSKHRPRNDPKLYGGKYPFIQTGDVRNSNHLITSYGQTYNEAGLAQSKLWPKGTLCITIAANIAETGILDFAACFPDSVIGVVVDDAVTSSRFLEYLMQSFKTHLQAQGKGSAQDNINIGTFEKQMFPFPPLTEQETIASQLDALQSRLQGLEELYRKKLALLEQLQESLLHHAFTGAI